MVTIEGKPRRFATDSAKAFPSLGLNVALGEIDPAAGTAMDLAEPLALTGTSRAGRP